MKKENQGVSINLGFTLMRSKTGPKKLGVNIEHLVTKGVKA